MTEMKERKTGMSSYKTRKGLVAVLVLALVAVAAMGMLLAGCGDEETTDTDETKATTAAAETTESTEAGLAAADLVGAGASFPNPVYVDWIGGFKAAYPQITVDYTAVGSGAGIEQFTAQTTDFGGTDAYMDAEEKAAAEDARPGATVYHIPTVFGAVVLAYNVPGLDSLKLDSDTIVDIFMRNITKWNDPAIAAINPDVELPDADITVVHRSDSSGTTNAFTGYLTSVSSKWADAIGKGKEVNWPADTVGGQKNDGVAAAISNTENAIGYVELAYAVLNNMTMADVKNSSGNFITPSLESTSLAANVDPVPADLNLKVDNSDVADAYPIVSATYIMVYDKMDDADKAAALRAFLTWALGPEGDALAEALGYATLPPAVETKALETIALIGS
jgi:phosphate transport system substrate-binding protein